jgi:Beta-lactamase
MLRSWRRRLPAACAARLAVAVVTMSHSVWAAELPDVDALMLRLMATDKVPGAALALIKDANIVLEQGYGFRDLAAAAPVTTATLFNIGSISKSFTALGLAQRYRQLVRSVSGMQAMGIGDRGLLPTHVADLVPDLERLVPGGSVLRSSEVITAEVEEVIDLIMG